jgi:hypothetical protein
MAVFIGANRSNVLSALLPLECYFLTVNCLPILAANSRDRKIGFQPVSAAEHLA